MPFWLKFRTLAQDSFGIQGGWDNPDAPDRRYLRLLKNIDVSEQDQVDRFRDMIGDGVTVHGRITAYAPTDVHVIRMDAISACPSTGSRILP